MSIVKLTEEDSKRVATELVISQEFERHVREKEHDRWLEKQDVRDKTELTYRRANLLVNVVNIFHWMLLCLILYKFWTL